MEDRLVDIDIGRLRAPVRAALKSESAEPVSWASSAITRGAGGGVRESVVYRLQGRAKVAGRTQRWRTILKILRSPGGAVPPSDDWKREAEAYRSGLFDTLPDGLVAPRCLGFESLHDGSYRLWLEDVTEEIIEWPLERYGLAARQLGRFAALFLSGEPSPRWSWLSTDFIRQDLAHIIAEESRLQESMTLPTMRNFFSSDSLGCALGVLADREKYLEALQALPSTICHFDAFRRNMMSRRSHGRDQTVLIDWAFVGLGPIGAELASLVWVSLASMEVRAADAANLSRTVYTAFLAGMREAGWRGDERLVRLGYTASIALRRLGTYGHALSAILDESLLSWIGHSGVSMGQCADQWAQAGEYVDTLADEARSLIDEIA